jgi:hypothetical protein
VTVYLPDEITLRARRDKVNLSGTLRGALSRLFAETDAAEALKGEARLFELNLEDANWHQYTGRIRGVRIAESGDQHVYLTQKGNVLVHDWFRAKKVLVADAEAELRDLIEPGAYVDAMRALGKDVVLDLDL